MCLFNLYGLFPSLTSEMGVDLVSGSVKMTPNKSQIKDEAKVEGMRSELYLI